MAGIKGTGRKKVTTKEVEQGIEEVVEELQPIQQYAVPVDFNGRNDELFTVKLDSKRFEDRTFSQMMDLISGSVGVVSKVTIERKK